MLLLDEYDYKRQQKRAGDLPVQELSDNLDNFYLAETLRQACAMKAHRAVYAQSSYQQPFSEVVLSHLDLNTIDNTPSIAAYFYAFHAQDGENTEGGTLINLKIY